MVCIQFPAAAVVSEFHGNGLLDYRVTPPPQVGVDPVVTHLEFEFTVSNALWHVVTRPVAASDASLFEAFYDGTNTYSIIRLNEKALQNKNLKIDRSKASNMITEILPTEMPPAKADGLNAVWLAFCSGNLIRNAPKNKVRPVWFYSNPAVYAMDHFVQCSYSMLPEGDQFLKSCTMFSDGIEYGLSNGVPRITGLFQYPEPFTKGFARAGYSVLESTNVDGTAFPKVFHLQVLMPEEGGKSASDVKVAAEFRGSLTNITVGVGGMPLAVEVAPRAMVSDYRSLKMEPPLLLVQYRSPSNKWLDFAPGTEPYQLYRKQLGAMPAFLASGGATGGHRRTVIIGLLLVVSGLFLVILLKLKTKRDPL